MKNLIRVSFLVGTVAASVFAMPKVRWVPYRSNLLNLEISVPAEWTPAKIPKALAFHYDDLSGGNAAIGVLKSDQISDIEWAANKELETEGHPEDWTRAPASVGGHRAIKITGTDFKDSTKRFVHYYVAAPRGVYIVQCVGTADRWSIYSPTFSTILTKLKFF